MNRIIAGIILLRCIGSSVAIITMILAGYLAAEGVVAIFGALKLRGNAGWVWTLINGLASLVLGFMVFSRWPKNSVAVLGLLFGIHAPFQRHIAPDAGSFRPKSDRMTDSNLRLS